MTVISYTQPSGPVPFHQPQVRARDTDPNAFGHSLQPRYLLKAFTILGKVWAFLDMATLARGLGEDVAAAFGDVGWRVHYLDSQDQSRKDAPQEQVQSPTKSTNSQHLRCKDTAKSLPLFQTRWTPSSSAMYATAFSLYVFSDMTFIGCSILGFGKSYRVSVNSPRRIFIRQ